MFTGLFTLGALCIVLALAVLCYLLFASPVPRVSKQRRLDTHEPSEPLLRVVNRGFVTAVDRVLKSRGWVPFRAEELERAEINRPVGVFVSWVVLGTLAALVLGSLAGRSPVSGILLAVLVPVGAKLVLRVRAGRRTKKFADQLDNTLRVVASALRAGQSLPMALSAVAADSPAPMSQEVTRIINEVRLGRDIVASMLDVADRVESEDFRWFAEAVAVQRETGGSLNDIIDTVAETIRDRVEIREKVRASAAEGKASALVLMGLPVVLGLGYSLLKPGYMDPMFTTGVGLALTCVSAVLYVIAWFWMRAIVAVKV